MCCDRRVLDSLRREEVIRRTNSTHRSFDSIIMIDFFRQPTKSACRRTWFSPGPKPVFEIMRDLLPDCRYQVVFWSEKPHGKIKCPVPEAGYRANSRATEGGNFSTMKAQPSSNQKKLHPIELSKPPHLNWLNSCHETS